MASQEQMEAVAKREFKQLAKEFHEFWKQNGEPHPSSNAYLALNRIFFYAKGMQRGVELMASDEAMEDFGL